MEVHDEIGDWAGLFFNNYANNYTNMQIIIQTKKKIQNLPKESWSIDFCNR